jgi:hypothetical protein
MPLSPHETKVLAGLEEELRDEDPGLVATPSRAPSPSSVFRLPLTSRNTISTRQALLLLGALFSLVALGTAFAEQLGVLGLGALTVAAVLPWLLTTARSAQRRSRTSGATTREGSRTGQKGRSRTGRGLPPAAERAALVVAIALVVALALAPLAWQPVLAYALTLLAAALMPGLVTHVVEQFEGADSPSRRRDRAPAAQAAGGALSRARRDAGSGSTSVPDDEPALGWRTDRTSGSRRRVNAAGRAGAARPGRVRW